LLRFSFILSSISSREAAILTKLCVFISSFMLG
jgi:hypothetical protein